mgnify:CR=1 FL=1
MTYTIWGTDGTFRTPYARGVHDPEPYIAQAKRAGLTAVEAVPDEDEDARWERAARDHDEYAYGQAERSHRGNTTTPSYTIWGTNKHGHREAFARYVFAPAGFVERAKASGLIDVEAVLDFGRSRYGRNPATHRAMTEEAARTVISQLGGMGRLRTMVGAYDLLRGYDEAGWPAFSFKFKGSKSFNFARITLTPLDVYAVRIGKVSGYKLINVKDFTDIYAEQLRPLFERTTGLYLSM